MKRILIASIFLFLLASVGVTCVTSRRPFYSANWPKTNDTDAEIAQRLLDQTIKVEVSATIDLSPLREIMGNDYPIDGKHIIKSSGSGSVTDVSFFNKMTKVESLVLTAYHVCHVPETFNPGFFLPPLNVIESEIKTISSSGNVLPASVIFEDKKNDTCVLRVMGNAGRVAKIATELPPVGARIIHAGAPTGTYGKHLGVIIDGRYAGIENFSKAGFDNDVVVLALPAEPGSSGGGVYYRGKLFATLNWSSGRGGNISWGVKLNNINIALTEARNTWRSLHN